MQYEYDVFLSYSRKFPHLEWVDDIFLPLFQAYLSEACNKDVKIFKDTEEIHTGNDWRNKIRTSLVRSRVMVSVFSPAYFRSEWCVREFSVFYHRSKALGLLSDANPQGLIVPLKLFDGQHFPTYASALQMKDFEKYNLVGGSVKHSNGYLEFQKEMQIWVHDVAAALLLAPAFDTVWSQDEWIDVPFDNLWVTAIPNSIKPPSL
jgi:TIR domain